jgi:Clp amino terminal domain, pathogenicity island component
VNVSRICSTLVPVAAANSRFALAGIDARSSDSPEMEDSEGMATPLIAKELQASFREAISDAKSMRHEYLTVEHLLLALTREPKTQKILVACGASVERLRQRLEKFLADTVERLPESARAEPQQTIGIERVLQRAAIHALTADQKVIEGSDVLVAMLREDDSHALFLLQQEGITRLDLLNYLSAGIPKQGAAFLVQGEVSRDIWNAFVRYRGEQEIQLGREYSMSEALNALLGKALGLEPPPE